MRQSLVPASFRKRGRIQAFAAVFLISALASDPAAAAWFLSPSVGWESVAARPIEDVPTVTYYGLYGSLSTGFDISQIVDFGLYGRYLPASLGRTKLGVTDARVSSYGLELSVRLADSVHLGVSGGLSSDDFLKSAAAGEAPGADLVGRYRGRTGGVSIGAVTRQGKQSFFQTSLEVLHTVEGKIGDASAEKRRFDAFALSLAYVFSPLKSDLLENTIFNNFLDTLNFF